MNKIKTAEALADFLDERLVARKLEIVYLKNCLDDKAKKHSKETLVLSKALIVISYSHWEGYVKEAVKAYLNYLNSKGLQHRELSTSLFAAYIHTSLFQKALNPVDAIDKIESLISETHGSVRFNSDYIADTESNLKMDILLKIMKRIGMAAQPWEEYRAYLDSVILKHRNDFAHGDNGYVDIDTAKNIADKVIEMMQRFETELLNIVELKTYHI